MSQVSVTFIDVGWGDSIFIESIDSTGKKHFALIDSNDTVYYRSSFIFLKKYFERSYGGTNIPSPVFSFVLLSHAHADHGQGLKSIMREYGTLYFYYPKSIEWSALKILLNYAVRSSKVSHHEAINKDKFIPDLGDASIKVLWPPYEYSNRNENNNSIVLTLQLNDINIVLTGDAEAEVWKNISNDIPQNTGIFKVPHHGSVNGTFDSTGNTPWLNGCPKDSMFAISAHNRPFGHPDKEVIDLLDKNNRKYFRTDEHYHLTFITDGVNVTTKYSHI